MSSKKVGGLINIDKYVNIGYTLLVIKYNSFLAFLKAGTLPKRALEGLNKFI